MNIFQIIIEIIAAFIGLFGGFVIVVGVYKAAKIYVQQNNDLFFKHSRLELTQHLILGLDFLVAKDVLDSLAVRTDTVVLLNLAVLVGLRILLTHFVNKELDELNLIQKKPTSIKKPATIKKKKVNSKKEPKK